MFTITSIKREWAWWNATSKVFTKRLYCRLVGLTSTVHLDDCCEQLGKLSIIVKVLSLVISQNLIFYTYIKNILKRTEVVMPKVIQQNVNCKIYIKIYKNMFTFLWNYIHLCITPYIFIWLYVLLKKPENMSHNLIIICLAYKQNTPASPQTVQKNQISNNLTLAQTG